MSPEHQSETKGETKGVSKNRVVGVARLYQRLYRKTHMPGSIGVGKARFMQHKT